MLGAVLAGATLLGGVASLWFFWDKIRLVFTQLPAVPSQPAPSRPDPPPRRAARPEVKKKQSPGVHLETQILKQLVTADGEPVALNALVHSTGASNIQMQAALEHLASMLLIEVMDEVDTGHTHVWLTMGGRRYVVDHGIA